MFSVYICSLQTVTAANVFVYLCSSGVRAYVGLYGSGLFNFGYSVSLPTLFAKKNVFFIILVNVLIMK